MLQSLPSDAKWCGPAAVSALTGQPYREVLQILERIQAEKEVTGTWGEDVILTLGELGYVAKAVQIPRLMQLKTFMASRTPEQFANTMLIGVYKHWLTAHMGWACDNWTKRPVPFDQFPKPCRLVEEAFVIRKRIS